MVWIRFIKIRFMHLLLFAPQITNRISAIKSNFCLWKRLCDRMSKCQRSLKSLTRRTQVHVKHSYYWCCAKLLGFRDKRFVPTSFLLRLHRIQKGSGAKNLILTNEAGFKVLADIPFRTLGWGPGLRPLSYALWMTMCILAEFKWGNGFLNGTTLLYLMATLVMFSSEDALSLDEVQYWSTGWNDCSVEMVKWIIVIHAWNKRSAENWMNHWWKHVLL